MSDYSFKISCDMSALEKELNLIKRMTEPNKDYGSMMKDFYNTDLIRNSLFDFTHDKEVEAQGIVFRVTPSGILKSITTMMHNNMRSESIVAAVIKELCLQESLTTKLKNQRTENGHKM